MTVSCVLTGEYGINGVALSLPTVVGMNGIEKILPVEFTPGELEKLKNSAEVLKQILLSIDVK